ncbi:hypothetical protein SEA_KISI_88 [Mycobacterium phage KiSi]|uniref:Uncharacterized protein n=1 Tax=Mycobacterium phage KiSi TaxID=2507856 RepID=A0A410TBU2_9CAUD|nr:hypothetical protein I5G98_gp020 [Mycobacterium phage KiSi]QAU06506.1 hypothetical protein SEA_KISI_88 [Mycobacterium phage KiSi]
MGYPVIRLHADRQHGLTTALLDVALANARRGKRVAFCSPTPRECEYSARAALDLIVGDDAVSSVSHVNGAKAVFYVNGGAVSFLRDRPDDRDGFDVEVYDSGPDGSAEIVRPREVVRDARR